MFNSFHFVLLGALQSHVDATALLFPDGVFGLSAGCSAALIAPLNCTTALNRTSSLYTWQGLTAANITSLCTTACTNSIASYRTNAIKACGNETYVDPATNASAVQQIYGTSDTTAIYDVGNVAVKPIALADYFFTNYNLLCNTDNSSPAQFCYIKSHPNTTATGPGSQVTNCDICNFKALSVQLQDARLYDAVLASIYSSLSSSCKITLPALTTPTAVYSSNPATAVYNTTTPPCTGSKIAPSTTACDAFAAANSMSTEDMLRTNGLASGCANWPGGLSQICVQDSCKPYTVQKNDTCLSVATKSNITVTQLLSWNPTIDPLCVNFNQTVGHVICLSSPFGYTVPTATVNNAPTLGPTSAAPIPSNADPKANTRCGSWYNVSSGDYCAYVVNKQHISLSDFYFLNPDINSNCTNLLAGVSYCVAPVGDISTYSGYGGSTPQSSITPATDLAWSTLATATTPSYSAIATSTGFPLANGSLTDCYVMFNNNQGPISCFNAADEFGVSINQFVLWNPSLGDVTTYNPANCTLKNATQYCGSYYDPSTVPVVVDPGYIAPNLSPGVNSTSMCLDWWDVGSGDTCNSICNTTDIAFSDFLTWNPSVGSTCNGLWLNTSYCVAGPGYEDSRFQTSAPTKSPTTSPTTGTTTATNPPAPTQSGIKSDCSQYYVAKSGDTCSQIAANYSIPLSEFVSWNPAVKSDCSGLYAGYAYCVNAPGATHVTTPVTTTKPTTTTGGPPGPTQSGITSKCNKYGVAQSGDGCSVFAQRWNITLANLYAWNAVLQNNCSNFLAGDAYCVGVSS